jgi:hypothetical protein
MGIFRIVEISACDYAVYGHMPLNTSLRASAICFIANLKSECGCKVRMFINCIGDA